MNVLSRISLSLNTVFLEQFLTLFRLHAQIRRHQVDQVAGIVDIEGGGHQFIGKMRDQRDQTLEELQRVAGQCLDFDCFLDRLRESLDPGDQEGLFGDPLDHAHPLATLHGQANAAVGDAHHLQDAADCADRADIVRSGALELGFVLQEETDAAIARHDIVDQAK